MLNFCMILNKFTVIDKTNIQDCEINSKAENKIEGIIHHKKMFGKNIFRLHYSDKKNFIEYIKIGVFSWLSRWYYF